MPLYIKGEKQSPKAGWSRCVGSTPWACPSKDDQDWDAVSALEIDIYPNLDSAIIDATSHQRPNCLGSVMARWDFLGVI